MWHANAAPSTPVRLGTAAAGLALIVSSLAACTSSTGTPTDTGAETGDITIWAHQGEQAEADALKAVVDGFNKSQTGITAKLTLLPENDYPKTIAATKPSDMPDVVEVDGPTVAALVYNKKIRPIDDLVAPATKTNALPSILAQGTLDDSLYALGVFDSGLGIWGNKKLLDAAGVKYPTSLDNAWTDKEFTAALAALAAADKDKKVLDVKENYGFGARSAWTTYGFGPVLWSAGADFLANGKADGTLNSTAAVNALTTVQSWKQYIDPNTNDDAFTKGQVALSWVGHWVYPGYQKALGSDLVLLPLPDFGNGPKSGQGSWAWGAGAQTKKGKAAGKFLDYLLSDANVATIVKANGAPPGTKSAVAASDLYKPGGPLQLYTDGLGKTCGTGAISRSCVTVPRPLTAGFPVLSEQFGLAFGEIYKGADVKASLDKAAKAIDIDFADNGDYKN